MTGDYVSDLRAFCAEYLKYNVGYDLVDSGFGPEHGGELTVAKLTAALDELERLRKDVAKLGEHVAPVDDREPMDVNWAAEELYAYVDKRGTQSQFGDQLRAVLDSRQSWRYRAFKLEDDVEQLRTEHTALGRAEHQLRIVSPNGPIHSFTQRDLDDHANWLPGVRLEQRTVYGTPWEPADLQQLEHKGSEGPS